MSKEVAAAAKAGGGTADGAERCGCGAELTPLHDPFGTGDKACAPCRDRGFEAQKNALTVRGIDLYGP